ncbi:hypothetical protein TNCV_4831081 [Trichonephila clavipes]|nr:hypothetical protein TNCV_4831081 [Trichonephila clavipes]
MSIGNLYPGVHTIRRIWNRCVQDGNTERRPGFQRTPINSRYTFGVLRPVTVPFIRTLQNPTFQQDNARPNVPVLYGPSSMQKMFDFCPNLHGPW